MCRLLAIRAQSPFACASHLHAFAQIAEASPEYQGHGWGCAWLDAGGAWQTYHNICPIWEDESRPSITTRVLVAHARSAFRNEGIVVENNMPFCDGPRVFAFNGELHGVRIREEGRIGAERIFNFIKRFDQHDISTATAKALRIIEMRTRYIRAMNIVLADADRLLVSSLFNEDPDYFRLHRRDLPGSTIVCSQPYPGESGWQPIPNRTLRTFP